MLDAAIGGAPLWLAPFRRPVAGGAKGATRVALQIEEEILAGGWRSGALFGSVKSLEGRYGIGRSVAREAIRILEIRGDGRLRRGPKGGLVIARPDLARTSFGLAGLLLGSSATLADLAAARRAIDGELDALAARADRPAAPGGTLAAHLAVRLALADRLGNPALLLFVRCLNDLTLGVAGAAALDRLAIQVEAPPATAGAAMQAIDRAAFRGHPSSTPLGALVRVADLDGLSSSHSSAAGIARTVAGEIQAGRWPPGARIGSEIELCERFAVSRMTLRQAVRLLEEFGVARMQAGRGNGLFANARTDPTATIRMAHGFLAARHWAGGGWWQAMRPVQSALVEAAEQRLPPAQRDAYRAMIAQVRRETSLRRVMNGQAEIVRIIAGAAANPILQLFSDIAMTYRHRILTETISDNRAVCERMAAQADAYLDGFLAMRPGAYRDIHRLMSIPIDSNDADWVTRSAFHEQAV